jgi:hypothetical protein
MYITTYYKPQLLYIKMQSTQATTVSSASKFIRSKQWDTQANRYMQPRVSDRGLKTVAIISSQKNKKLHIQMPSVTCWGITDYTDQATGESDGRFSLKMHFTNNSSEDAKEALNKLQQFEQQVLSDAVTNSEAWFGKKQTREIVEFSYFPFLKPGKNPETKQPDPENKGTYFRPKVNCYSGKWDVNVFDPEGIPVFPTENEADTPMDFVPSGSAVICGIECKHIWIGAKGWGITWALKECVVMPKLTENMNGRLQLDLSESERAAMYNAPPPSAIPDPAEEDAVEAPVVKQENTYVEDSGDEEEAAPEKEETPELPPPPSKPVKKTVAKKEVVAEQPPAVETAPAKKKVVRKKTT